VTIGPSAGDPFDALGDPNRRAIVELLRAGDRSVRQLADELPISRPAVSRHLRLLKQAGLVADRAEGTRRLYRLHDEGVAAVREYLERVWGEAAVRFRLLAENHTPRAEAGQPLTEPIEIEFTVACPPRHAFELWAVKTSLWWPSDHSVSGEPGLTVTFEPRRGGRIFERTPDGSEHDWGEVLAWEPPERLVYLWHLAQDRSHATEVEVTFHGDDDRTTVRIVHRGWDRLGDAGPDLQQRNRRGWRGLIPHYQRACADLSPA
jgi:DNA-binding transcriptional ArsR family regulator/uncharacterized protein YndB with AHSA1/START domain